VALGEVTNTIDFNSSLTSDGVEESMFFMSSTMELIYSRMIYCWLFFLIVVWYNNQMSPC